MRSAIFGSSLRVDSLTASKLVSSSALQSAFVVPSAVDLSASSLRMNSVGLLSSEDDVVVIGSSLVVRQTPPVCLSVVVAPSQAEALAPQACLDVPEPSDAGSPVQVHQIGDAVDGYVQGIVSESKLVSNSVSQEAILFPWEEDFSASPWEEASRAGVADTVETPVSEVIPAKAGFLVFKGKGSLSRESFACFFLFALENCLVSWGG